MPKIEPHHIARIKERADLRAIVSEVCKARRAGQSIFALCPFHKEKSGSLHVTGSFYKCFGCGASGDVFTWAMNYEHLSFYDAVQWVADRTGYILEVKQQTPLEASRERSERQQAMQVAREVNDWVLIMRQRVAMAREALEDAGVDASEDPHRTIAQFEYQLQSADHGGRIKLYLECHRRQPTETARLVGQYRAEQRVLDRAVEAMVAENLDLGLFELVGERIW